MPGRVLIVDDEQSMCELIETDLRLRGFDSAWRTSAEEALQLLQSEDFDVVLTDLKMPGMSGTELCERVVANLGRHLSDLGYAVLVFDYFGYGNSVGSSIEVGLPGLVQDIDDACDLLAGAGIGRISLVGIRWGAALACQAVEAGVNAGARGCVVFVHAVSPAAIRGRPVTRPGHSAAARCPGKRRSGRRQAPASSAPRCGTASGRCSRRSGR